MGNKASTDEPNVDAPHEREAPGLTGLCCNGRDYEKETANLRIYFFLVYDIPKADTQQPPAQGPEPNT